MTPDELDLEDADIPQMAVEALNAATRRSLESGLTIVVAQGDELVRIGPEGRTVLKTLPPLEKVSVRVKRASH
jgi:hypothetical protein